jgi:hypothetical protein
MAACHLDPSINLWDRPYVAIQRGSGGDVLALIISGPLSSSFSLIPPTEFREFVVPIETDNVEKV